MERGRKTFERKAADAIEEALDRLGSVKSKGSMLEELHEVYELLLVAKERVAEMTTARPAA